MTRYVAFIRAINGAPTNRIKMVDLAAHLEQAGCSDVSWYLQTGNMFLTAPKRCSRGATAAAIEGVLHGYGLRRTDVMLRTPAEVHELVARSPFSRWSPDDFKFTVSFLKTPPSLTPIGKLECQQIELAYADETVVCLAVPRDAPLSGGISTVIDKPWGTASTTRWWNVVEAVAERC